MRLAFKFMECTTTIPTQENAEMAREHCNIIEFPACKTCTQRAMVNVPLLFSTIPKSPIMLSSRMLLRVCTILSRSHVKLVAKLALSPASDSCILILDLLRLGGSTSAENDALWTANATCSYLCLACFKATSPWALRPRGYEPVSAPPQSPSPTSPFPPDWSRS
jgi:hypothetical protein